LKIEKKSGKKVVKITSSLNALAKAQNLNDLSNQVPQTITNCWKS